MILSLSAGTCSGRITRIKKNPRITGVAWGAFWKSQSNIQVKVTRSKTLVSLAMVLWLWSQEMHVKFQISICYHLPNISRRQNSLQILNLLGVTCKVKQTVGQNEKVIPQVSLMLCRGHKKWMLLMMQVLKDFKETGYSALVGIYLAKPQKLCKLNLQLWSQGMHVKLTIPHPLDTNLPKLIDNVTLSTLFTFRYE